MLQSVVYFQIGISYLFTHQKKYEQSNRYITDDKMNEKDIPKFWYLFIYFWRYFSAVLPLKGWTGHQLARNSMYQLDTRQPAGTNCRSKSPLSQRRKKGGEIIILKKSFISHMLITISYYIHKMLWWLWIYTPIWTSVCDPCPASWVLLQEQWSGKNAKLLV